MKENFSAVIDRLEEDQAVLKFPNDQTLNVPIDFLPEEAKEGSVLDIFFGENFINQEKKENQVKDLLNEILKRP